MILKKMLQHILVSVIIFKTAWWTCSLVYSRCLRINVITLHLLFPTNRSCKVSLCVVCVFNLPEKGVSLLVVVLPWFWRNRRPWKSFQRSHVPGLPLQPHSSAPCRRPSQIPLKSRKTFTECNSFSNKFSSWKEDLLF